jgi:ATP-dependent helicase/nuclease subunit A
MDAVNGVFQGVEGFTPHLAQDSDLPGRIEVLPLAVGGESAAAARNGLRNPLDQPRQDEGVVAREKEAVVIAARIRDMVGRWVLRNKHDEAHPERLARYADIMLLVRARTHLEAYERALRDAGIPYFSSRKGGLLQSLEIADITALLRFLITPFTDLDLALALRSPVFSCTDDDLMALAGEGEGSWWERLRRLVGAETTSTALIRAHQLIDSWLVRADGLPVHDLLDRIYFEADVLARYRSSVPERMADTVEGNLVAFLELALAVDAGRYPSLPRFLDELAQMRDGDPQDAPDQGELAEDGDAVRILTVHGAKGLEAPVVFLIDAHGGERKEGAYGVLLDWPTDAERPRHFSIYGTRADRGPARRGLFDQEEAQSAQEESNALYVAMTRAMQVLIVSGSKLKKDAGAASWHSRIRMALGIGEEGGAFGDELETATVPLETHAVRVPKASAQVDDEPMRRPLNIGRREERFSSPQTRRGERIHRLLQFMAPPAPASDPAWLRELLDGDDADFEDAWQAAKGILEADSLRRFFEPAHYRWAANEWPIIAEGEARRLDRVVEFEDEIWVLDYKTGEAVASDPAPSAGDLYRAQLDLYVRAVSRLMPGKTVRSALIFAGGLLHVVH